MTLNDIQKLAKSGETETVEFKKSTRLLSRTFESVCAFLNGNGGTVLIEVNDSGKIVGQEVSDATKRGIANEASKLEPTAHLSINYYPINANSG